MSEKTNRSFLPLKNKTLAISSTLPRLMLPFIKKIKKRIFRTDLKLQHPTSLPTELQNPLIFKARKSLLIRTIISSLTLKLVITNTPTTTQGFSSAPNFIRQMNRTKAPAKTNFFKAILPCTTKV